MKARRNAPRARRAPCRRLAVPAGQSRELVKFAGILEIRTEDFLKWILTDMLRDLRNPASGLLASWAGDQINYGNPEDAERVGNRAAAWLERRRVRTARRDGKEGRAS